MSAPERGGVLGRIDCPCCGYAQGMRITKDKNGHPFGFCDAECRVQMRIGPDPDRVAAFARRFPWAYPGGAEKKPDALGAAVAAGMPPRPAPAQAAAPAPAAPAIKAKPASAPAPATRQRSSMDEALAFLGMK